MPDAGYLARQTVFFETLPTVGTLGPYEGTIITAAGLANVGTTVGGVVINTRQATSIESIFALDGLINASIVGVRVIGYGKALGSIVGTNIGTIIADSNTVLIQLWQEINPTISGTVIGSLLIPTQVPTGSKFVGSINFVVRGC